ncbi:MAG TPA: MATE family efflux transporter [Gammaproteobacteria bacterium]|nr:MATE family efflux transporter [Gammaproteobacteria bacterium]
MQLFKFQEIRITIALTIPLLASFLAQKGMQLIDTIMMGWIGPEALAAAALGTGIFMTSVMFCRGVLSATGVFIARARGAEQTDDVKSCLQQSVYVALMLSLPCMLLIWAAPYILTLLGQQVIIVANAKALLYGLIWGVPGFLLFFVYREFISAFSLMRVVMFVTLISIPLTFVANYVLIYGKLGLPALGVAGIGYASALVMWFMFLCLWVYSKKHPHLKPHLIRKKWVLESKMITEILSVGVPTGIISVLDNLMFLMAVILVGYFGVVALAAFQIAMQCITIAFNVPMAFAITTSLQVGHALGAGDFNKARRIAWLGLMLGLLASMLTVMPFLFVPEVLAKLFLKINEANYQQIINAATTFLLIAALFQCFDAVQAVTNGILRGFKDTLIPMLYSIACYLVIGIGGGYYLAFHTHLGAIGVWYALTLAIISAACLLIWRFLQRLRRKEKGNLQ